MSEMSGLGPLMYPEVAPSENLGVSEIPGKGEYQKHRGQESRSVRETRDRIPGIMPEWHYPECQRHREEGVSETPEIEPH